MTQLLESSEKEAAIPQGATRSGAPITVASEEFLREFDDGTPTRSPATTRPAIVLVNLGTPQAPTAKAVRPFLREFLSDRRVIEMHPLLWKLILETCILPTRPTRSARAYASVWTDQGSPLMVASQQQGEAIADLFADTADVRIAMRYGQPSIPSVLDDLYAQGTRRVLIVPLYPQYAASSAGTVVDEVARWSLTARDQMEIRTVRSFPDSAAYINALATAVETRWAEVGRPDFAAGDKLVMSFHSIPQAMKDAGDPYQQECLLTSCLLRTRLGLNPADTMTTFQSVFGRAQWIGPATIDTMEKLGKQGTCRVDVICPGFMADCLETLEEIDMQNRTMFCTNGGTQFEYIPWANNSRGCIDTISDQVRTHLQGWA